MLLGAILFCLGKIQHLQEMQLIGHVFKGEALPLQEMQLFY